MVWRGKLEKTNGGLKKKDLIKLGYKTEKGVFKKFTKKTKKKTNKKK